MRPLSLFFFLVAAVLAEASPAKYPARLVNGRLVDLKPLCAWWINHTGARPLTGWVHLTGSVTATNTWGWVIDGKVPERSPGGAEEHKPEDSHKAHKILLLHPPLQDIVTFEQLTAELKTLNDTRAQLAGEEGNLKGMQKTVSQEQSAARHNRVRSNALAQEGKGLTAQEKATKAQLDSVDKQIHALKSRLAAYPSSEHYTLDCFALDTGREQNGLPVYDHGTVYQQ